MSVYRHRALVLVVALHVRNHSAWRMSLIYLVGKVWEGESPFPSHRPRPGGTRIRCALSRALHQSRTWLALVSPCFDILTAYSSRVGGGGNKQERRAFSWWTQTRFFTGGGVCNNSIHQVPAHLGGHPVFSFPGDVNGLGSVFRWRLSLLISAVIVRLDI